MIQGTCKNMMQGLAVLILLAITANALSITLDGIWQGTITHCDTGSNATYCNNGINFPARVPGGIYTDLMNANIIPNNLVGNNDAKNRWVGNQSLTYHTTFNVTNVFMEAPRVLIVFHGIDTFARIFINDHEIGETTNMFVRYTFDIKCYLKLGKNGLKIILASPVKTAEILFNKQAQEYVVPPVCVPEDYNGECHVNHIRKMQASFSWDWGPAFPSMGIWKSVELIPVQHITISEISTDVQSYGEVWRIVTEIVFESASTERIPVNISSELGVNDTMTLSNVTVSSLQAREKSSQIKTILNVPAKYIKLWWPNGYGDQPLYKLTITLRTPRSVSRKSVRIGFRKIELVQEPLKKGRTFYFRINDVPIFAKGSNFIPASVFPERGADEKVIRHLLSSSKVTYMNMLRVWGGGVYESELFYDLADEYGIMIWQDFMFACGMYPTTYDFLESVRTEVAQNVRRLKNHVSVVLWAGNNENEAALYGNWYGTGSGKIYRDDYIKLYVDLIKNAVEQLDPTRPFLVSSPSNGMYAAEYNYTGEDPYSKLYGDVHYYDYVKNSWDINQYPRARFSSEYGFQSLPSVYTIAAATESKADLDVNSSFLKHRQHLPMGKMFLQSLVARNFEIPKTNDTLADFVHFIYLTQVNQAVSQRIQTESYRQARTDLNSLGEGMTMGALYWQLNDVWQAPSWSSIDYDGRWKMLHYYAMEFFHPIIVTTRLSSANDLSIYVVSDRLVAIPNSAVDIYVHRLNSTTPIYSKHLQNITIEINGAQIVDTFWLDEFLEQAGCGSLSKAREHCIVKITLSDKSGTEIAPPNYVYPGAIKFMKLPLADVSMLVEEQYLPGKYWNYPDFSIKLTTKEIALFVWIETRTVRGRLSENGFHMFQSEKRIIFHAGEAVTPDVLQKDLILITLSDIYNPTRQNYYI